MTAEVAAGVVEQPELDGGPTAHPELDAQEVRRLALQGFAAMALRAIGQRGLQMIGNVLLARWLAPETIGIYLIVSFVVGIAGFLADLGLGAALVQRRDALTEADQRSAFTLSLAVNGAFVIALWFLAEPLVRLYDVSSANVTPIRVMALSMLLGALTVVPVIRLERALRFKQIAFADLAGSVVYVSVTVPLAFQFRAPSVAEANVDTAVWVFVLGSLATRVVYTAIVMRLSPWSPRFAFDGASLRSLLAFGIPYQLNGFVNALKDNFIPTFIAFAVSAKAVGYVGWAVGVATNALILIPIVSRITFPTYSRLQHDPEALREAIEKSIKWVAATVFPAVLLLAALGRQIVEHIYGPKWAPGLPSFYLLLIPMLNAAYSTVMVSALYGLGKAKTVLRLTVIWAAAGWLLGAPLTLALGMHGFAIAMSIVSWLSLLAVREMNKVLRVTFVPTMLKIFVLAGIPAAIIAPIARFIVHDAMAVLALGFAGGAAYLALMLLAGELRDVIDMLHRRRDRIAADRAAAAAPAGDPPGGAAVEPPSEPQTEPSESPLERPDATTGGAADA